MPRLQPPNEPIIEIINYVNYTFWVQRYDNIIIVGKVLIKIITYCMYVYMHVRTWALRAYYMHAHVLDILSTL